MIHRRRLGQITFAETKQSSFPNTRPFCVWFIKMIIITDGMIREESMLSSFSGIRPITGGGWGDGGKHPTITTTTTESQSEYRTARPHTTCEITKTRGRRGGAGEKMIVDCWPEKMRVTWANHSHTSLRAGTVNLLVRVRTVLWRHTKIVSRRLISFHHIFIITPSIFSFLHSLARSVIWNYWNAALVSKMATAIC